MLGLSHINPVAQQPQWFSGDTVPTLSSRSLGFNPRLSKLHANNGLLYYITCIVSCLVWRWNYLGFVGGFISKS